MISLNDASLMMIEPSGAPTTEPAIDVLTRRMAGALNVATHRNRYRGIHMCTGLGCDASSDNTDHMVGDLMTNSLAVHYLAYHRADVPIEERAKVAELQVAEAEPTSYQLTGRPDDGGRRSKVYR